MKVVINKVVRQNMLLTAALVLTIIGSIVCALFPPLVLKCIVNEITTGSSTVLDLAFLYFATLVIAGLFDAVKEVFITIAGQKVTKGVRKEMCGKLGRLQASYYIEHESGKITSRFVNDVDTVEALFDNGIISMVADTFKVISILVMIFIMSKGLGLLMVVVTPLLFLMTRVFQKKMLKAQLANRVAIAKVNNHVPETIENIRMIHTFGKEAYMEQKYESYIEESYGAVEKSNFYDAIYSPIILVISAVIIAVMMVFSAKGGSMQTFFGMSVGTAVAIIAYVGKVFDPLESIGMEIQNIQSAVAGIRRINEFLSTEEQQPKDEELQIENLTAGKTKNDICIQFSHVDFGYTSEEKVLEDCELSIYSGENVTLAGRTGAGKSTAFKLIMGMYKAEKGNITVYGVPAEQIPDSKKRNLFGYVEQSFQMVPGTIAEQISLFDPAITNHEIETAAKMVGIHDSIMELKNQYETKCTSALFSKGQFQLLSIARAIVKNPPILLLDEITANLDSETEKNVLAAIENASKNRTVVSISHRVYEKTKHGRLIMW